MKLRTILVFGLALGLCLGQTRSATVHWALNGDTFSSGNAVWYASNGTVIGSTGAVGWESRRDDGRGPTLQLIRASARRVTDSQLAPEGYAELAASVGVEGPGAEARMLQVIHDANLPVYDGGKVDEYLYRAALRQGTQVRWVWHPLRQRDVKPITESVGQWSSVEHGLVSVSKVYSLPVPMSALATLKTVLARIPDAIALVSDYEVIRPDPFLGITTPSLLAAGKVWIIAQWDEPGFGVPAEAVPSAKPVLITQR